MLNVDKSEEVERKRGAELRNHLVRSRSVALIKSGQALSLRPDLLKSKLWADELGKLVDEVGSFPDVDAMNIMREELSDLLPRLKNIKRTEASTKQRLVTKGKKTRLQRLVESDPILSLFEFYNDCRVVASASVGQVYKARLRRGPALEAILGKTEAAKWGGKTVAIKIQRPDVAASAALDMYLIRRTAMWLSKFRGGDLVSIADTFGMQLFGELDYIREAKNCERFRELYGGWEDVVVPQACTSLTRKKVLIMEWVEGTKGPWMGSDGIEMVRIGLRCSTDQLLRTGLFHADPHRGNLLRTPKGHLAVIDYGMMADIPRASDVSFSKLQMELDDISRDNLLKFKIPPYITIIIRSLTILEGFALSVDPNFRLIRGAYPYILKQLLSPEGLEQTPKALEKLLVRLLTVNGEKKEVEWGRLRQLLQLAETASKSYDPSKDNDDDKGSVSRKTVDLFLKFMTSKTGLFMKEPLVHELAEAIDGMASIGESNLLRMSRGIIRPLPGGNGPVNKKRIVEIRAVIEVLQSALSVDNDADKNGNDRLELFRGLAQELLLILNDPSQRELVKPILEEVTSVTQMVAVEVLEIRSSRAIRGVLGLVEAR
ncbi:ABC1 kinase family protein [Skeletonema marinoi]|uniref:ABC1 kinase family protein n=1 Tax=Skeletonema marinoi TaxID=267567 RepID=A0AAD8YJL2_9STRA|nr:ABC1 kinase family protein [Skeletonema marinoi]